MIFLQPCKNHDVKFENCDGRCLNCTICSISLSFCSRLSILRFSAAIDCDRPWLRRLGDNGAMSSTSSQTIKTFKWWIQCCVISHFEGKRPYRIGLPIKPASCHLFPNQGWKKAIKFQCGRPSGFKNVIVACHKII